MYKKYTFIPFVFKGITKNYFHSSIVNQVILLTIINIQIKFTCFRSLIG